MSSTVATRALLRSLVACLAALTLRGQDERPATIENFHFAGTTLGGRAIDQDSLRKHVVIVDLWGTWCGPCRQAVPVLVDLHQKYKHHGLEILGFGFNSNGGPEDADAERRFAAEQKITYELLPGDKAVRDQVPDFRGYPTMLLFERDLKHVDTHVGFGPELAAELEQWVRKALALDTAAGPDGQPAAEPVEEVPAGRLFEPGNADRGVELELTTIQGETLTLASLRGNPVLLAITTSWDRQAATTAKFLRSIQSQLPGTRIIAWHVERDTDAGQRTERVRAFLAENPATYSACATGLAAVQARVHRFASLPTFLVFDKEGVLSAREAGSADDIERRIREKLTELTAK